MEITIPPLGERRLSTRHAILSTVYVRSPGQAPLRCQTVNCSEEGVLLECPPGLLVAGAPTELMFITSFGMLKRITYRAAQVVYRTAGHAGCYLLP